MSIESVENAIQRVRKQLEKFDLYNYGRSYNETATRNALINPVLEGLGWDINAMDQCAVELEMPEARIYRRPDYVLYNSSGAIVIVIEAKAAKSSWTAKLSESEQQLTDCTEGIGPGVAALTNGLIWRLYVLDSTREPLPNRITKQVDVRSRDGKNAESAQSLYDLLAKDLWS